MSVNLGVPLDVPIKGVILYLTIPVLLEGFIQLILTSRLLEEADTPVGTAKGFISADGLEEIPRKVSGSPTARIENE